MEQKEPDKAPLPENFYTLKDMTHEERLAIGMKAWDDSLALFPVEWVDHIPSDLEVCDINGDRSLWKDNDEDTDQRFGAIAYGIAVPGYNPRMSVDRESTHAE